MAKLEHPKPIQVRIRWSDGRLQTIGEVDGTKFEHFEKDNSGSYPRFQESGEIDGDGHHIFRQAD